MHTAKGRLINGNLTLTVFQAEKNTPSRVFFSAHSKEAINFTMFIAFRALLFKVVMNKTES